jgi:dipeptidyl aminopeptidase/acylaminoacyl peptidase
MHTEEIKPYGEWRSPISASLIATGSRPLARPRMHGGDLYWLEGRAAEGGRMTLMRARPGQAQVECTPAPFNVRTRVHEYGGGAYLPFDGGVVFSHFADNRLYLRRGDAAAMPVTAGDKHRHADFAYDAARARVICVREDHAHSDLQPVNTICAVALDGSGMQTVLAEGADFYAAPRLSPDGGQLAWLCWNHPRMPWETTELWLADVAEDGTLDHARRIAGGGSESICQPEWSPDGRLYYVSDRSGWWNLYRLAGAAVQAVLPKDAEFGCPHWVLGESMYGFLSSGEIGCTYIENGISHLARLDLAGGVLHAIVTGHTDIQELHAAAGALLAIGGSPTAPLEVAHIDAATGAVDVLARGIDALPPAGHLSVPSSIRYPGSGGRNVQAFHYAPANADYRAPEGERPPLIVISHGGPTSMATSTLKLSIQYWTSRGFAVLDVNYGGSSGFGRAYQDALKGQWGIVDVEDCVNGARTLAERGLVDPERLIIRGGSAGGFTTLCALANHDVFKAGASHYGVSDLKALDADSHKFESHYNNYLIAPAPECERLYLERSPVHHPERLRRPMIFFQGLDDKVVPPAQSEVMVEALRKRGVPVAYLTFEGEGHGFRKSENIRRALEAELYFYARVFGFALADPVQPVVIENL